MFARLTKKKTAFPKPEKSEFVTADHLVFPDSNTLDYFKELIGGFIHKHNNCLTVTQGFSQLLVADDHGSSVTDSAETIQMSAQKAIELNSRILACTATDTPNLTEFDFTDYFKNRCAKEKNATLTREIDFDFPIIRLGRHDSSRLELAQHHSR